MSHSGRNHPPARTRGCGMRPPQTHPRVSISPDWAACATLFPTAGKCGHPESQSGLRVTPDIPG